MGEVDLPLGGHEALVLPARQRLPRRLGQASGEGEAGQGGEGLLRRGRQDEARGRRRQQQGGGGELCRGQGGPRDLPQRRRAAAHLLPRLQADRRRQRALTLPGLLLHLIRNVDDDGGGGDNNNNRGGGRRGERTRCARAVWPR